MEIVSDTLEEVDSLDAIDERAGQDDRVHEEVDRLRDKRLGLAIRVSVAAELLQVSAPTVRAWTEEGVLEDVGGRPKRVTLRSVRQARDVVTELRRLGRNTKLRAAVLAAVEDRSALQDKRLRKSLDEMRRGKLVELTPPGG